MPTVYPKLGETFPDASGSMITSIGAVVDESKYIEDAIRDGGLLTWDPYGAYQPEDRRTSLEAPDSAKYIVDGPAPGLPNAVPLLAGEGIFFERPTSGGLRVNSTAPFPPNAYPSEIGLVGSVGTIGHYAAADHVHPHLSLPGGDLHAEATEYDAGFLSAADKAILSQISDEGALPSGSPFVTAGVTSLLPGERELVADTTGYEFVDAGAGSTYTLRRRTSTFSVSTFVDGTKYQLATLVDWEQEYGRLSQKVSGATQGLSSIWQIDVTRILPKTVKTITKAGVRLHSPLGMRPMPQLKPKVEFYRSLAPDYSTFSLLGSAVDPSTLIAEYTAVHPVAVSMSLSYVPGCYCVWVYGEYGTNSTQGLMVSSVFVEGTYKV